MKDFLQDLVAHTHSLGFLPLVKITSNDVETVIESMAEDRSVIMFGKTHVPIPDITGQFGMPNLSKLDLHLKCPEYNENAKINIIIAKRNGEQVPVGIHFENAAGDYQNDYRFMSMEIINEKMKSVKFKGAKWNIEFAPTVAAIQRLKFQSLANKEESVFQAQTDSANNLVFSFGDQSSHTGRFVFQSDAGKLASTMAWPVNQVQSILNLDGESFMRFSDAGALQITINSGLAEYNYILPAQVK